MKAKRNIILTTALFSAAALPALAAEPETTDKEVAAAEEVKAEEQPKIKQTNYTDDYEKFRFGGYGEMVASFMDYGKNRFSGANYGNTREHRSTIAIPRFVLALDYKFNSKWVLGAEIEFEAGGVGIEQEMESAPGGTENMEYEREMEKGGEVALEQFHITRLINPAFNVRVGHMIVPLGLTNSHHEPINFFGTSRPEGETTILPSTWHETGVSVFGTLGRGYANFDYQAMVVAGLNPDGFGMLNWVQGGKQGLFESDNFSSPAYVARLNYNGVPGLRLGASAYYCHDVLKNADKSWKYSSIGRSALKIFSFDGQYKNQYVTARANVIWGNLDNASAIGNVVTGNKSNTNSYPTGVRRHVAKTALCYGGELGVNVSKFFKKGKCPVIYPFVRYDYYNPQQKGDDNQTMQNILQVSKWTAGVNWYALPNLVVKADYTTRQIGTQKVFGTTKFNSENELSFGIAYIGWFTKR